MPIRLVTKFAPLAAIAALAAGCASISDSLTTASIPEQPKVDPACVTLTAQIDALRKDGVQEKIEKAAAKKYKMTALDLAKADQLNKANADFQARCSTLAPRNQQTAQTQTTAQAQAQEPTLPGAGAQ